jgi:general secretion pathway protein I
MKHINQSAFTLIEVLIALVIISIALLAIVKTTIYVTHDSEYLQNKISANLVANYAITSLQTNIHSSPVNNMPLKELHHVYYWSSVEEKTPDVYVDKIIVSIKDEPNSKPILTRAAYIYVLQKQLFMPLSPR